jgi:hypothetical protein
MDGVRNSLAEPESSGRRPGNSCWAGSAAQVPDFHQ